MPNITSIPAPRVPFVDDRTGLISREWYRFMLNLFTLTGSGTSDLTITDLAIAPNPVDPSTVLGSAIEQSQLASITAQYSQFLDIVGVAPVAQVQMPLFDDLTPRAELGTMAAQNAEKVAITGGTIAGCNIVAPETHAATSKTTPVDADELPLVDSAASNVLKKLTWANLKATLASWINGGTIAGFFTTLAANASLLVSGGRAQFTGWGSAPASGSGVEVGFSGGIGYVISYDRTGAAYMPSEYFCSTLTIKNSGTVMGYFTTSGLNATPIGATTKASGAFTTLTATTACAAPVVQATGAAGFKSSDGSTGYTGTVTTGSLVGKTITIKDGIITAFA